MYKRALYLLLALIMVPVLANAKTYWAITATTSPIALKSNLTVAAPALPGDYYTTLNGVTNVTSDTLGSVNFQVYDAPTYKLLSVKVDGKVVGSAAGTYTVNKGTLLNHTIVATYAPATTSYTLTTKAAAGGTITPSKTYSTNAAITVTPAVGYTLTGVKIGATANPLISTVYPLTGTPPLPAGVTKNAAGGATGATYTFASGNYTMNGIFVADPALKKAIISNPDQTVATGTAIAIDASGSSPNAAGYTWAATCGTVTPIITIADPLGMKATYTASSVAETCTVTMTLTGSSPAISDSVIFTIINKNIADVNSCRACHNGIDGPTVPGWVDTAFTGTFSCATCHNPGNTDSHPYEGYVALEKGNFNKSSHVTTTHNPTLITCTDCHSHNAADATAATASFVSGAKSCQRCHTPGGNYSVYSSNGLINAKHFNANVGATNSAANIASYVASATATNCSDCHGHDNTINAAYAESGHGNLMGIGWEHYDFEWRTPAGKQDYVNGVISSDCNRCHTTTGYNYFVGSAFTTISGSGVKPAVRETLYCNGCHTSAEGTLKAVGAFTGNFNYNSTKTGPLHLTKSFTNWNESNLCVPCHSGRGTGEMAKATGAFDTYTGSVTPFSLHHAQPAGLLSGYGAYNFTSGDFTYQDRMRHMRIGVGNYNETGSAGPCVGCHFSSEESHSLEATTKDTNGLFSGINIETCQKCHPTSFTYQDLNDKKVEFDAAVKVLGNLITSKGLTNNGRTAMKWFKIGEVTRTAAVAEKNMGAFINYNIVTDSDKALWLHNPALARRIVNDSIDWLDDSSLNSSANATIVAQATAGTISATEKLAANSFTADPGCLGCHFGTGGFLDDGEAVPGIEQAPHYNANGTTVPGQTFTQAQFVVPGAQCNNCHGFGHGTDSPGGAIISDYAESQHGSINGLAWTDYDFKTRATCVMCHTTTGFVNAFGKTVTAGVANAQLTAWGTTADTTKQVLGCNACHSSTAWKTSIRTAAGGVTVPMGVASNSTTPSVLMTFADVGESNVCIPCHASRENGASLIAANNASFTNPHYLAAAATFYGKGGFQFYTSGVRYNTYGAAGKTGKNANWSHGRLGMDNYSGSGNNDLAGKSNNTGNKGQCIACHLGPKNTHTFGAAEVANETMAGSTSLTGGLPMTRTCYGCHKGNATSAVPTIEAFIEEEVEIWNRMYDFYKWQLAQYGINYTPNYPYFSFNSGVTFANAVVGTTFGGAGVTDANKTEGTAMNLKLLIAEKGAPVHNRSFGRALIADSMVYLQKGAVGDYKETATDPNQIIKFSDYSTARPTSYPGQVGPDISISTLKTYLIRTGGAQGTFVPPFTRR